MNVSETGSDFTYTRQNAKEVRIGIGRQQNIESSQTRGMPLAQSSCMLLGGLRARAHR